MPPPKLSPHAGSVEVASPACSCRTQALRLLGLPLPPPLKQQRASKGGPRPSTPLLPTALLQELRSDLRFLCPFCVHRKYTALKAASAGSPITGPLYFPPDFSQTRTETDTPTVPLSQSSVASPTAPGRPGDVVHQKGRPRVSTSTGSSSWRPSRRKHNPKSRRTRRRLRRQAREHEAHQLLTYKLEVAGQHADGPGLFLLIHCACGSRLSYTRDLAWLWKVLPALERLSQ